MPEPTQHSQWKLLRIDDFGVCVCGWARWFQVHRNNYTNTMYCKFKTKRLHIALTHTQPDYVETEKERAATKKCGCKLNEIEMSCNLSYLWWVQLRLQYRHWRYAESLFASPLSTAMAIFYQTFYSWNKWISLNVWKMLNDSVCGRAHDSLPHSAVTAGMRWTLVKINNVLQIVCALASSVRLFAVRLEWLAYGCLSWAFK